MVGDILIVDYDNINRYCIYDNLKNKYNVYLCKSTHEIFSFINTKKIDLVILKYENNETIDTINKIKDNQMILVILELDSKIDLKLKNRLLTENIDDFINESIDFDELNFRIRKALKNLESDTIIKIDDVIISEKDNSIRNKESVVYLQLKEFKILHLLLSNPNRIFLKEEILNYIWWNNVDADINTIRTHINKIRKQIKIFDDFKIVTVKGMGYKSIIKNKQ